ncbi:hypothetical protein ACLKA6_010867 [Drosophila palustris]
MWPKDEWAKNAADSRVNREGRRENGLPWNALSGELVDAGVEAGATTSDCSWQWTALRETGDDDTVE